MDTLALVGRLRITVTPGPLDTPCYVSGLSPSQRYAQLHVRLSTGRYRMTSAHRVVWETMRGPVPEGLHVCHRCDVTKCVNLAHLYVGTPARNVQDQVDRGRRPRGAAINTARLTPEDVRAIRNADDGPAVLARRYGVSRMAIHRVRTRQAWAWLP